MKMIIATSAISIGLTGCAADPITVGMLTGDMTTAFQLLEGNGNVFRQPDGTTKFTFVIHDSATNFQKGSDENSKEDFRQFRLGSWLASKNACTNGYEIKQKTITKEPVAHLYEGVCK